MANITKYGDHFHDGWNRAVELRQWLGAGNAPRPQPQQYFIPQPGECYFCTIGVRVHVYTDVTVEYSESMFIAGRGLTGMALTAGASMLLNKANRERARREAAAQWRDLGDSNVHITDHRLVMRIEGHLESLWYGAGMTEFAPRWDEYAAYIGVDDSPPLRLVGPGVPYLSVMVHFLIFGSVPSMATTA